MSAGFVVSDKNRRAVFSEIVHGERDAERIAKKHRILRPVVDRVVEELARENLIAEEDGGYKLTGDGEKVAEELRRQDLLQL